MSMSTHTGKREEGRRRITFSKIVMRDLRLSTITAIFFLLTFFLPLAYAQLDYATASANLSTIWINNNSSLQYSDSSYYQLRSILQSPNTGRGACYTFGFYCKADSLSKCDGNAYLLAIFIMQTRFVLTPHPVWYANRNHPVGRNATLALTSAGDLSLLDADGTLVWSTNTSDKGVHTLTLHPTGNLVLANAQNRFLWESFEYPADILVLGQILKYGTRLIASTSIYNSSQGPYYMQMETTGLTLYADDPVTPQPYWSEPYLPDIDHPSKMLNIPYALYRNGNLDLFISSITTPDNSIAIPRIPPKTLSYLQLGVDGTVQVYLCNTTDGSWSMLVNLQEEYVNSCSLPTICGPYGICTNGLCSCLPAAYGIGSQPTDGFSPVQSSIPSLGCTFKPPLLCNASTAAAHHFFRLDNFYYPNVNYLPYSLNNMSIQECQQRCLQNCSYTAAIFITNNYNQTIGVCYPVSRLYTITQNVPEILEYAKSVVLMRMQSTVTSPFIPPHQVLTPQESPRRPAVNLATIVSVVLCSTTVVGLVLLGLFFVYRRRRKRREEAEDEEDMFEAVQGLIPTRFSLKELKAATKNFSKILGAGGFGSVFFGALPDGSEVAVKRLESANQGWKQFRTEVRIIGSINHVNLVRLQGFCTEKEQRLLVYEYMPKGSLEKWLFRRTNIPVTSNNNDDDDDAGKNFVLGWGLRFNIALGTARGLAYLHEGCSQRIIHLDIKPANILLDDHFVAKVSDFGLSKLMNREQSRVVTTMRGTPGYLAPEWLHASVTEKADVYSFGILLFEITSGRKSVDMSVEGSEVRHIPVWASRMVEEGRLMDVIDARLLQEFNREQAETMVKVALWCIQENPTNRPSMGTVVQMFEGVVECPNPPLNVSHLLSTANQYTRTTFDSPNSDSTMESEPLASILSGSR